MKVLLIHPKLENDFFSNVRLPPLGTAYIAAALQAANHSVKILDANLEKDQYRAVRSALEAFSPRVVGVSMTTPLLKTSLRIAAQVKAFDARIAVIMGGVHPTLFPEAIAAERDVDYVVAGEGEFTVVELLGEIAHGRDPLNIRGIAFRQGGRTIVTPARPVIRELDQLPFPAYDLLPVGRYAGPQIEKTPFMAMITSRGCPHHCIFCDARVVMGREYRIHSPERTVREMKYLVNRFGIREIMFKDSEFVLSRKRIEVLCDLILRERLRVRWSCNGRADHIDMELLLRMKQAGCRLIQFGVESGDQDILDRLKKGTTISQVRSAFRSCRKAGLKTVANFMIGNPGESESSIAKTVRLAREIRTDFVNFSYVLPYPGTELHRLALRDHWIPETFDPSDLRSDQCPMNATHLKTERLKRMMGRAYRSFYFSPRIISKRIFTFNPTTWAGNINGFIKIFKMGNSTRSEGRS